MARSIRSSAGPRRSRRRRKTPPGRSTIPASLEERTVAVTWSPIPSGYEVARVFRMTRSTSIPRRRQYWCAERSCRSVGSPSVESMVARRIGQSPETPDGPEHRLRAPVGEELRLGAHGAGDWRRRARRPAAGRRPRPPRRCSARAARSAPPSRRDPARAAPSGDPGSGPPARRPARRVVATRVVKAAEAERPGSSRRRQRSAKIGSITAPVVPLSSAPSSSAAGARGRIGRVRGSGSGRSRR